MEKKKIFTILVLITLIASTFSLFEISTSAGLSSNEESIAEHKEFTQPTRMEQDQYNNLEYLSLHYDYQMTYDHPPENIISRLKGNYDPSDEIAVVFIEVKRPDNETVRVLHEQIDENGNIEERYSFIRGKIRENIYEFGEQFVTGDAPYIHQVEINRVLFGVADENILSDPEVLEGNYTISINIFGEDISMDYGADETVLKIMSHPPGPVEDLTAKAGDSEVTLQWSPPTDKGGSEIIQYNIYRATTAEGYKLIGNVTSDVTSYTDRDVVNRELYFYKVAPINLDTEGVEEGDMSGNIGNPFWRSAYEKVIAYPTSEDRDEDTTGAYRWSMDYSYLTEDYIEERMDTSVEVNNISGGMVGMYRLDEKGMEDGLKIFDYEGGFYSYGGADVLVEYEDGTTFTITADVEKSMIDFSGTLWVNESKEGLDRDSTVYSIEKQTLRSSGEIDLEYKYEYESEDTLQTSKVDLNMSWDLSLDKDFDGSAPWLCLDSTQPIYSDSYTINYSGDLTGDIDLNIENQGTYSNESIDIDENYHENLLNSRRFWRGINWVGPGRDYSPIFGSCKLGFYRIMGDTLGINNNVLGSIQYIDDIMWISILTNNKQVHSSEGEIHTRHYLDPLTVPGLHSILEAGFVRINFVDSENLEQLIMNQIRAEAQAEEIQRMNRTEYENWRDMREQQLTQLYFSEALTEPFWEIWDQQSGVDGINPYYGGGPILNVIGFEESESIQTDEVDEFMEDKEAYSEATLEKEKGVTEDDIVENDWLPIILVILIGSVLISIFGYFKKSIKGD